MTCKLCELCGASYEVIPGRGANNRISCYNCTDTPDSRSPHWRNKHLKRTYGITHFEYTQMYEHQKGRCKICDKAISFLGENLRAGDARAKDGPCVDHCHTTGVVRGLLCFHCNTALGHVFDDLSILDKMQEYLVTKNPP